MTKRTTTCLPDEAFWVILQHVTLQDYASLRLASRSVSLRTTQHVPYIALQLCDSSSTQQLQQWYQATRQFQHVSSVHIHVTDKVSAEVFEQAMQLLAQRPCIAELHLPAVPGSRSTKAVIPTLQPLQRVLPQLKRLAVTDIAVQDMPRDLQHVAAAAAVAGGTGGGAVNGWQLQSLTLNADWNHHVGFDEWFKFPIALVQ